MPENATFPPSPSPSPSPLYPPRTQPHTYGGGGSMETKINITFQIQTIDNQSLHAN